MSSRIPRRLPSWAARLATTDPISGSVIDALAKTLTGCVSENLDLAKNLDIELKALPGTVCMG